MKEPIANQPQNPTAEDLAGVTLVIEGEEDLTIRPRQIPPQQLPPLQRANKNSPQSLGEHHLLFENEEQ